jgi:riboflavin kinase/FMN adenylyltransferase
VPREGAYAVSVDVEGASEQLYGMMNVGSRPTFGISEPTLEVNIFDFDGDIYDRKISVKFLSRLRDDVKFGDMEALEKQLNDDKRRAVEIINEEKKQQLK